MIEHILYSAIVGLQITTIVNQRRIRKQLDNMGTGNANASADFERSVQRIVDAICARHDQLLAALPKRRTRKAAQ